jgi:hypothetical protein
VNACRCLPVRVLGTWARREEREESKLTTVWETVPFTNSPSKKPLHKRNTDPESAPELSLTTDLQGDRGHCHSGQTAHNCLPISHFKGTLQKCMLLC